MKRAIRGERQALRPAERARKRMHLSLPVDAVDVVVRIERWRGDEQLLLAAHRQVERGDAGGNRRKLGSAAITYAKYGSRSIPHVHRSLVVERNPARDAQIARHLLMRTVVLDPVHSALEAAGHIEVSIRAEGQRSRVDDSGRKRLAGAAAGHAEYRYRGFLTARPAVGDEKIACPVEYRVVDLVQSSRPAGANRDISSFERRARNFHRRAAPFQVRRNDDDETAGRCECHSGSSLANLHGRYVVD